MGELVHTSSLKNGSVLPRGFGSGTETQTGYTRFALLPSLCWIPGQPVSEIPGKSGQPTPGSPGRAARTDWTSRTCPDRDARDDRDAQTARQGRAARCPELPGARIGLPGVSLQIPDTVTRPGNPGQKKIRALRAARPVRSRPLCHFLINIQWMKPKIPKTEN